MIARCYRCRFPILEDEHFASTPKGFFHTRCLAEQIDDWYRGRDEER